MEYWIWLSQIPCVGPAMQKKLLEHFIDPYNIYTATRKTLLAINGIGEITVDNIMRFRLENVASILETVDKQSIKLVTSSDNELSEVFSCKRTPILFYYLGKLPKKRGIAIVGARRCTHDAKRAAEEIAQSIVKSGLSVISGLAKGVDSYAHSATVNANGHTTAVLAGGVDICYPKEHRRLYEKILASNGAIVSAYPPGTNPYPKHFVERNAHISALSTDVVVVQASEKSGSLTTANFAIEQGRNLFAVPHSIYLPEARGSNRLLVEGASLYLNPASLKLSPTSTTGQKQVTLTELEEKIISFLKQKFPCTISELSQNLQISELELLPLLMQMEIAELVQLKGTMIYYQLQD